MNLRRKERKCVDNNERKKVKKKRKKGKSKGWNNTEREIYEKKEARNRVIDKRNRIRKDGKKREEGRI